MTNAIHYATDRIFNEVHFELLSKAFRPLMYAGYADNRSLDERVRDEVIVRKVMIDVNLVGGQQTILTLDTAYAKLLPEGIIFEVPLHMTQGRKIMSVLSVEQNVNNLSHGFSSVGSSSGSLGGAGTNLFNAANGAEPLGTPNVELVGPNTIFLRETGVTGFLVLRCVLENDPNLGNISPRHYPHFGDMCVLAAKALTWNKLAIQLAEGSIQPGSINGYLRSALDNYSDAEEMYREMRSGKWKKLAMMNDGITRNQINRMSLYRR